ncbi:MAG: Stp1/IreP family PP2C-type Ser/Thr phosphatase [Solirubrobacterales bacterium]|nr:Stp1/IreP family PP2C-type Ser/Thr phosphatase [Solirubrobacterales bacterium]
MLRVASHSERTDVGRHRQANEDSYLATSPLFVVADGMGGAQAGEVASLSAVQVFQNGLPDGSQEAGLVELISIANRTVHEQARADANLAGMGTTITAAAVDGKRDQVTVAHVGDSRAYRLRQGILQRLTKDHSLVEEMRRRGQITAQQAEQHPQRSIITRALGPEPEVQVDVQSVAADPEDVFMLCSDGLTTMLGDEQIADLINGATSLEAATRALIDEANRAGGRDNITVILFQVEDPRRPLRAGRPLGRGGVTRARGTEHLPRRRLGVVAKVVASLAVVAVLVAGLYVASRQVWFLGTDQAGRVALYRGLPYELPFGLDLYSIRYSSPIQTDSLDQQRQRAVTGHSLRSKSDATSLIEDIESREGV